LDKDLK